MGTLFQIGTITGFLQGVYDGDINIKKLSQQGDIGLGTFNGVNGEMIAVNGVFYRSDATGHVEKVNPDRLTPFALVSHHKPSVIFTIPNAKNCNELNNLIDAKLPTKNIFYMIRINADIDWIKLRSEGCQTLPYRPLAETLPAKQHLF